MNYRMIFIVHSKSQIMSILYFKWNGVLKVKSCQEGYVTPSVSSQESPFSCFSVDLVYDCMVGVNQLAGLN